MVCCCLINFHENDRRSLVVVYSPCIRSAEAVRKCSSAPPLLPSGLLVDTTPLKAIESLRKAEQAADPDEATKYIAFKNRPGYREGQRLRLEGE